MSRLSNELNAEAVVRILTQERIDKKKDCSNNSKKLDNGDAIHMHPPPPQTKTMCPLFRQDCMKAECEWFMAVDDECAIYRIARCIL